MIKLKNHPIYIGKQSPSYGIVCDQIIENRIQHFAPQIITADDVLMLNQDHLPCWYVTKRKAKLWTNPSEMPASDKPDPIITFSQFVIETDFNGVISEIPMDQFLASY